MTLRGLRTSTVFAVAAVCALGLGLGLVAQQPAAAPAVKRTVASKSDLMGCTEREGVMVWVEIPVGGAEGRHTHNAEVFAFVLEGTLKLETRASPTRRSRRETSSATPRRKVARGGQRRHDAREDRRRVQRREGQAPHGPGEVAASARRDMFNQNYNPFGNAFVSTLVAAIPIAVLLYFIALHPHRSADGTRRLGIAAPFAAFYAVIAAFVVACLAFGMPVPSAVSAFGLGSLSGFLGIIWIVLAAMFLYTMTVVTGKFEVVKESIVHISFDRRLQVLLIAFSFGAIIEGTSGFARPSRSRGRHGRPRLSPFQAAVLNLLANTAPSPGARSDSDRDPRVRERPLTSSRSLDGRTAAAVRVRPRPFWLVATFVKMEGGTWKEAFESGQVPWCPASPSPRCSGSRPPTLPTHLMTDVVSGVFSVICTALFLRFVWHPKSASSSGPSAPRASRRPPTRRTGSTATRSGRPRYAWAPWAILIACCAVWGSPGQQGEAEQPLRRREVQDDASARTSRARSLRAGTCPRSSQVQRTLPSRPRAPSPAARFTINWLSAAGTGVFFAALLSGLVLGPRARSGRRRSTHVETHEDAGLVIGQVLGLGFLTRYSGMDAVLGLAFTGRERRIPSSRLPRLARVFLTGRTPRRTRSSGVSSASRPSSST